MGDASAKVVVISGSPPTRDLLVAVLEAANGLHVAGMGADGEDAVRLALRMKPDVLVMDGHLRRATGLEATRRIMREIPTRIVMVTNGNAGADLSFEALQAGALTVVRTPLPGDAVACAELAQTVRLMAAVPVVHHWGRAERSTVTGGMASSCSVRHSRDRAEVPETLQAPVIPEQTEIIGVASSTGGPAALAALLGGVGPAYPVPILVVQHIKPGFAQRLSDWLQSKIGLRVSVAGDGQVLEPGTVLVAPDDYHLQVVASARVVALSKAPHYKGLRPSANPLFSSLAAAYGPKAVGVILTGMGDDGVDGLEALHRAGGFVIAQDASTSVVYGMPREAAARGIVDRVLSLDHIALALASLRRIRQVGVA